MHFFFNISEPRTQKQFFVDNSGNQSRYCGISDRTAIAVAMITPVSLALVFNVVCLTKSVYTFRQTIYHLQKLGKRFVLSFVLSLISREFFFFLLYLSRWIESTNKCLGEKGINNTNERFSSSSKETVLWVFVLKETKYEIWA